LCDFGDFFILQLFENVGDVFEYTSTQDPSYFGIEIDLITDLTETIAGMETVEVDGNSYDVWKRELSGDGVITYANIPIDFTMEGEMLITRDNYAVLKEIEDIKINVGSSLPDLDEPPEDYTVRGPNLMTAMPIEIPISYQEIAHCLDKSISKIETSILAVLEQTPPELYADVVNRGIYMAGGGSLLRGLSKRFTEKINIPFHLAEDPLQAIARGTGIALKNVDKFSFLMR